MYAPLQVLVVYLGLPMSVWLPPSDLKPYRPHKAEKELAASELASEKKLPKERQFKEAKEVTALHDLLHVLCHL